ncbi:MAG: hypothetical protein JNK05_05720 [Myxococcales bacterium]|nr:hypothetical protein [Myxococcales bacterium]
MARPKKPARKPSSPARKPAVPPADPDLAKLSPPLRKRAETLVARAQSKLAKQGRDAIARAKASLVDVSRNLWDVALALVELSRPGVLEALEYPGGRKGLDALAAKELSLESNTVDRLLVAAKRVDQEQFARLGLGTVNARLALADATPADDTRAILAGKSVQLWPEGPSVVVAKESDRALLRYASQTRQWVREQAEGDTKTRPKGRTTTADERKLAGDLGSALKKRGIACEATVRATKPGKPSVVDLTGLSILDAKALLDVLANSKAKPSR